MSEHKWQNGDRAAYGYEYCTGLQPCTVIGWDEPQDLYIVRFDNPQWGHYSGGLGVARDDSLRTISRTVEQITQEAVEDFEDGYAALETCPWRCGDVACADCDDNLFAAIILAAIEEAKDV